MYCPPRPTPRPALVALIRAALEGEGNLLGLLPNYAYRMDIGPLGYSRRSTVIVNRPDLRYRGTDYRVEMNKNFFKLQSSFTGFEVWKND